MIKKILRKILFPNTYSSKTYIDYLKKNGVSIGNNCYIWSPNNTIIDIQNSCMLEIGNYVKITRGVKILCHDYSVSVSRRYYHKHLGQAKRTIIGDNVFIGMDSIILPGTNLGNNTIVGAGSVVSGTFPDNVVIAGNPAKVIMSLEDYYRKKESNERANAFLFVSEFYKRNNKFPTIKDMGNAFAWLYLPRTKETVEEYKAFFKLSGDDYNEVVEDFMNSKGLYNSFNEFLEDYKKHYDNNKKGMSANE